MRRYGVMVAWNNKQFPQTTKNKELFVSSFSYDTKLSQIICLDVIAFSALLNDSMATYRSSHSTQFPFFLGSVELIQFFLSFIFIFNS